MDPQRPSSLVTVMFTDIESSTDTTTRLGDTAAAALFARHDVIVREVLDAHRGRQARSTGDGFLVLFASAREAVAAALDIQDALAQRGEGVRVRIGLNAGEVREDGDQLFGAAINLAKRVLDRAGGGQVLATEAVRQLVGTEPGVRFADRGRAELKGFPGRHRLFEVRRTAGTIPAVPRRAGRRRPSRALVAAAVLVAVVAAGAVALLVRRPLTAIAARANHVAVLDARTGELLDQAPVGVGPTEVRAWGDSVWVSNAADGTLTQVDRRTHDVRSTLTLGVRPDGLGAGPSGLWIADDARAVAQVVDPTFRTARSVRLAPPAWRTGANRPVLVAGDAVWVAGGTRLERIDPARRRVVRATPLGTDPHALAAGAGGVWVADGADGGVSRVDPATGTVEQTFQTGPGAGGIAVDDGGGVWVTVPLEDTVKRLDVDTGAVAETVRVPGRPSAIVSAGEALWVASPRAGTVTRIDARASRVTRTIRLRQSPQGLAVAGGRLWVALQELAAPPAGGAPGPGVLVVDELDGVDSTDPARRGVAGDSYYHAMCAQLFDYGDSPAPAGGEPRPELATGPPEIGDRGRAYTFRIRPGFRFSPPSGAPVTAQDVRHTIERILHPRTATFAPEYMADVAGLEDFSAGRTRHLRGVTASGNRLTVRLRAPSTTLTARLAGLDFCTVPAQTPIRRVSSELVPTAGPYYAAAFEPGRRLVLRRNPGYGGERRATVPEIRVELNARAQEAVAAVERGDADVAHQVPAALATALERRYGLNSAPARTGDQRYFTAPTPALHFFVLNATRPLFAERSVRAAASEAVDRTALASSVPIPERRPPGFPTDQFIPPGLRGYRDRSLFALNGPDGARRRAIAISPRRRAVLVTCSLPGCVEEAGIVRRDLAAVGIDVHVRAVALRQMFRILKDPGRAWDIGYTNNFIDYADPASFVSGPFGPGQENPGGFRDAALFRRIAAAKRLPDAARARAFESIDADLVRAGAAIPFATAATSDFFAARVGCQVLNPVYGVALGALCVDHS